MKKFLLILTLICISLMSFAFTISENGVAKANVVLSKNANEAEKFAAGEIVKYIKFISGADLKTVAEPVKGENNIYIGQSACNSLLKGYNWKSLENDGILIKCNENRLVLAGDKGSGTIYAVYTFLEDYLGVKYLNPDEDYTPNMPTIEIDKIDYTHVPDFMSREVYFEAYNHNPMLSLKMKLNGHHYDIPKELGGHMELLGFVHTLDRLMAPETYGKDHPEWFSYRNGERVITPNITQPCWSNKEMLGELTKNVFKWIEENPDAKIISVSQVDNNNYCQCEECSKLAEKYGQSGIMLLSLNEIADKVKAKYPDKYIETLAYTYSKDAPLGGVKPRDNVIIRLCFLGEDNVITLDNASRDTNKGFYKNLTDWSKISKNLYVWDYIVSFANFVILFPDFHIIQHNIQTYKENHAVAAFMQGDTFNKTGCFTDYKRYITARLLWDMNLDVAKETKAFMNAYYGPAGDDMTEFITYVNSVMEKSSASFSTGLIQNSFFSAQDWIKMFSLCNSALSKTENTKYYDRVKVNNICLHAGFLSATPEVMKEVEGANILTYKTKDEILKIVNEYLPTHGMPYYGENVKWEKGLYANSDARPKEGIKPDLCMKLGDTEWIDFQEKDLRKAFGDDNYSKIVDDPNASNGKALWMCGKYFDWYCQRNFSELFFDKSYKSGDVYITYRIDDPNNYDECVIGVYNDDVKADLFKVIIKNENPNDKNYRTVKIGTIDFVKDTPASNFYGCGAGVQDSCGIYLDRVFVILNK